MFDWGIFVVYSGMGATISPLTTILLSAWKKSFTADQFRENSSYFSLIFAILIIIIYLILTNIWLYETLLPQVLFLCVLALMALLARRILNKRINDTNSYLKWREPILVSLCSLVACCIYLYATILWHIRDGNEPIWFLVLSVCLLIGFSLLAVWAYVHEVSQVNRWVFSRVIEEEQFKKHFQGPLNDAVNLASHHCACATGDNSKTHDVDFFLSMLMRPAVYTKRLHEDISPSRGFYRIKSKMDICIPIDSASRNSIIIPVVLRSKKELTSELEFIDTDGNPLYRLNDAETEDVLAESLSCLFCTEGNCSGANQNKAKEFAAFIMNDLPNTSSPIVDSDLDCETQAILEELLLMFERVKPVCVRAIIRKHYQGNEHSAFPELADPNLECSLTVIRNTPLVPLVRETDNKKRLIVMWIKRQFTKHRLVYYYNLGNADRAQSYHLTFSGPEGSYFTGSNLRSTDPDRAKHFIASKMTMTNRYDQKNSRVYIKNGRGFCNAALRIEYEDRDHRALQSLCIASALSFALLTYAGVSYMYSDGSEGNVGLINLFNNFQYIAAFFAAITFAGLMSVWETLRTSHSEEWMWVSAFMIIASSLLALGLVVILQITSVAEGVDQSGSIIVSNKIVNNYGIAIDFTWIILMVLSFGAFFCLSLILFEKIKKHGSFVYKVPATRSMHDKWTIPIIPQNGTIGYESSIKNGGRDLDVYEGLFCLEWSDGWLVPIWSSLCNTHRTTDACFVKAVNETAESRVNDYAN